MFITIEGPIGVGKSSLTKLVSKEFNMFELYEIVQENPFLEKFYTNQQKYAFQTEMFFLTNRFTQLINLKKDYLDKDIDVVSDYNIYKNMIFARNSLSKYELDIFNDIYTSMTNNLVTNELTIFITASLNTLKYRIASRARSFEDDISDSYLEYLIDAYNTYINEKLIQTPQNIIILDGDKLDFVNNTSDQNYVLYLIKNKIENLEQNE